MMTVTSRNGGWRHRFLGLDGEPRRRNNRALSLLALIGAQAGDLPDDLHGIAIRLVGA